MHWADSPTIRASVERSDSLPPRPLVTVGVPVFNGGRFLRPCLDSLLTQDFRDFVLVISYNASTDNTASICAEYLKRDSRVSYVRHSRNVGMYANIESLFRRAESKYFKLANADDFWAPNMLSVCVAELERDPTVVLSYPLTILVDPQGKVIERYEGRLHVLDSSPVVRFRRVLNEARLINQLQGVIRLDALKQVRPLMSHPLADRVLLAELSMHGKISQVPEYIYFRRMHAASSSFNRSSEDHQVRYVLPAGARNIRWHAWRYHLGLLRRVLCAPLHPAEKLALVTYLARTIVWDRKALLSELVTGGRRLA